MWLCGTWSPRNLTVPQFKDLDAAEVSKAKRLFAQIDVDGSGTVDAEELRKFLTGLGHKVWGAPSRTRTRTLTLTLTLRPT